MILPKPIMSRTLLLMLLSGLAGLVLYREAVATLFLHVLNRHGSSHGVFVPFLTAFFLWTVRDRIKESTVNYSLAGVPVVIVCALPPLLGVASFQLLFIAYIGLICGLVLTLLGRAMFKTLAFPMLFLITMVPLPPDLYNRLADMSRTIAFGASLKILSLLNIPYLREGWNIELPNAMLFVAESCSGIRYLVSFVVFGLAYAYLFRSSTSGRIATVLATIPISLFASTCRLTIIFLMTYWVSPFWSERRPHIILSWFVFVAVLFSCIYLDQWIQKRREQGSE
ncbi:MAG: exosortase/archaeosortase family protein [Desulfobacteraceae bacterium]|nr:exosortase/archaeosortase family protein [Desulfobacteraceae bacterium]